MDADLRVAIYTYTRQPAYKPVKPVVIAERLGLIDDDRVVAVRRVIKKMVKAGELEYGPNHLVMPTDEGHPARENLAPKKKKKVEDTSNQVIGTFRRVSTGVYGLTAAGPPVRQSCAHRTNRADPPRTVCAAASASG